ncbi:hypothetical protein BC826DRAFT_1188804 [Russula brevipes]|nr:hypothetical protein BC826DRAFT_1188804 [Russula brevipes]
MAATPSQSAIPNDPATWHFHDRLQVIAHDARQCDVCGPWLTHFAHATALREDTLTEAEAQRNATILGQRSAECAELRQALSTTHAAMNDLRQDVNNMRDRLRSVDKANNRLRDELAEARKTNARLRDEAAQNARDHSPRPRKVARLRGTSPSPSRFSSCPDTPMLEDRAPAPSRPPPPFPPHIRAATTSQSPVQPSEAPSSSPSDSPMLQDRVPGQSRPPLSPFPPHIRAATTSLSPVQPSEAPSSSSHAHSPSLRGDLLPFLADPSPVVHVPSELLAPPPPAAFAPSPFLPTVGFHSLLPVIVQGEDKHLYAADSSAPLDATGGIDFSVYDRYVFAIGRWNGDQPAWTTTLVHRDFFLTPQAVTARSLHTLLPMSDVISGGRNGLLVSPASDPASEAAVESLFSNPRAGLYAAGYIERIRYTPPELRGDLHSGALKRWRALLRERHDARDACKPRGEPSPSAPTYAWKVWLKHSYDASAAKGRTFTYRGIPRIGTGTGFYQTAHIEGAKAVLAFVPLSKRGATVRGPPREPFLLAAAALLCVPERYPQTLAQLGLAVAPARLCTVRYSEASFGPLAAASPRSVARYMATIGVSAGEADLWRAWAAAYVEMELEERPGGARVEELRRARNSAHAHIDGDPGRWALRNVDAKAPGNYNPAVGVGKARRARRAEQALLLVGAAEAAEAGPSSVASAAQPESRPTGTRRPDTIEDADVVLKYPDPVDASEGDGDEHMGGA